jgi:hypothetical protein
VKGYQHPSNASISIGKWVNSFELVMNQSRVDKIGDAKSVVTLDVLFKALKRGYRLRRRWRNKPRILNNASPYKILMDLVFARLGIGPSVSGNSLQEYAMGIS